MKMTLHPLHNYPSEYQNTQHKDASGKKKVKAHSHGNSHSI